jgi:hypothetical protein
LTTAGATAGRLMFAGHVMDGGWVSTTVIEKLQDGPAEVVHVCVVGPVGKNEPDAGLQTIVPQTPVVDGGG